MAVELTEAQINGRFQILERPLAAPGKCAVCGAVDRPVVDFGFDLDYYGVVYICVEDYKAGAQLIGLIDVSQLVQPPSPSSEVRDLIDEYVNSISVISRRLSAGLDHIDWSSPNSADEKSDDVQELDGPKLSDDSNVESIDSGTTEQDSEPAIDEGSISLSDRSSNGPDGLFDWN